MLELDVRLTRGRFDLEARLTLTHPVTGLFGPSGSGKTTLLHVLAGLVLPQSGRIVLEGEVLFDAAKRIQVPPYRRRIGLVFQDSQLFPHLSVKHNLLYGCKLLPREQRVFSLNRIVELLELGPLLNGRPHHLSGGERQRVALGRALLASPRLLLLDEPLTSLDERLKQQILPFLRRVKDEIQIPMIYVSHAINEILHLTQQMVVLDGGRIIGQGPFSQVIRDHKVLKLAHSLGIENVLPVKVLRHHTTLGYTLAQFEPHLVYLPLSSAVPGSRAFVTVRAANVTLARHPVGDVTIHNQLPGTIMRITRVAHRMLVEIDIGTAALFVEVTVKAVHDLGFREGERVYCLITTQAFTYLGNDEDA
ncbi:MAG: molybdenum ABC transporter ATP-binding protein [Gammaproteobacteria bacterium]